MKIIAIDNFDREDCGTPDRLVAENVSNRYAKIITELLNIHYCHAASQYYYVVKPDDYKLRTFEPQGT